MWRLKIHSPNLTHQDQLTIQSVEKASVDLKEERTLMISSPCCHHFVYGCVCVRNWRYGVALWETQDPVMLEFDPHKRLKSFFKWGCVCVCVRETVRPLRWWWSLWFQSSFWPPSRLAAETRSGSEMTDWHHTEHKQTHTTKINHCFYFKFNIWFLLMLLV